MSTHANNSTINGLNIANARKIASRRFSENLDKVLYNPTTLEFDVYIYDTADKKKLDDFQEEWKEEFNIIIVTARPYKKSSK